MGYLSNEYRYVQLYLSTEFHSLLRIHSCARLNSTVSFSVHVKLFYRIIDSTVAPDQHQSGGANKIK